VACSSTPGRSIGVPAASSRASDRAARRAHSGSRTAPRSPAKRGRVSSAATESAWPTSSLARRRTARSSARHPRGARPVLDPIRPSSALPLILRRSEDRAYAARAPGPAPRDRRARTRGSEAREGLAHARREHRAGGGSGPRARRMRRNICAGRIEHTRFTSSRSAPWRSRSGRHQPVRISSQRRCRSSRSRSPAACRGRLGEREHAEGTCATRPSSHSARVFRSGSCVIWNMSEGGHGQASMMICSRGTCVPRRR